MSFFHNHSNMITCHQTGKTFTSWAAFIAHCKPFERSIRNEIDTYLASNDSLDYNHIKSSNLHVISKALLLGLLFQDMDSFESLVIPLTRSICWNKSSLTNPGWLYIICGDNAPHTDPYYEGDADRSFTPEWVDICTDITKLRSLATDCKEVASVIACILHLHGNTLPTAIRRSIVNHFAVY